MFRCERCRDTGIGTKKSGETTGAGQVMRIPSGDIENSVCKDWRIQLHANGFAGRCRLDTKVYVAGKISDILAPIL
jgi:hypothetical protein